MKLLTNLIFEPKGKHDPALAYTIKDTVMSADGSQVYFALQDVPAGTALNNEDYWKLQIDMHDTLVEMEEATVAAKAAATGAVSTSANQNLSEPQKVNARQNIGMDKIIESLSDPLNASGNPLAVKPVGGMAFESVVTEFMPKQAGSGDPYPGGAKGNLLPPVTARTEVVNGVTFTSDGNGTYTINGTTPNSTAALILELPEPITLPSDVTLYMHLRNSIVQGRVAIAFWYNGAQIDWTWAELQVNKIVASTLLAGKTIDSIRLYVEANNTVNLTLSPMLRLDATPIEFQPYSNIRPITGWDAVELNHAGKNLWSFGDINGTKSASREISIPAGNNVLSGVYTSSDTDSTQSRIIVSNTSGEKETFYVNRGERFACATNFSGPISGIVFYASTGNSASDGDAFTVKDIQFESGEVATPFTPYQGNDLHTLQIGQTVYGGKLDWLTGKLVAEWAKSTINGNAVLESQNVFRVYAGLPSYSGYRDVICDTYKGVKSYSAVTKTDMSIAISASGNVLIHDSRYDNADDFNAMLTASPVELVYELETPIEIQLTPTEIIALSGVNTLYGDGDTITVTGRQPKTNALETRLAALEAAMTNV